MTLPSSLSDSAQAIESDVLNFNFINSISQLTNRLDELTGLNLSTAVTPRNLRRFYSAYSAIGETLQSVRDRASEAAHSNVDDLKTNSHSHGRSCGCPACKGHSHADSSRKSAQFNTVAPDGRLLPGEEPVDSSQLKWTQTATFDGQKKTVVSFGFASNFTLNGLSSSQYRALFTAALQTWADHAPIVFQEVEVEGKGRDVDILVQVDNIDGKQGTLAEAYFPLFGDITFDGDEEWTEGVFLETALHELGHSLGLAHEDDVDAILNSELAYRFVDDLDPFLFSDDIKGIQRLYGAGNGAVVTLDDDDSDFQPDEVVEPTNLVINGSFESAPSEFRRYKTFSQIQGWQAIGDRVFQLDKRTETLGAAADGTTWVELDARQGNATFGQNVDTVTGQAYTLSVDFTDGGRSPSTTEVQVFWEGVLLDTLTGGSKGQWRSYEFDVFGSDRGVSTLAFRAIGKADYTGGFIDNVQVVAQPGQAFKQALVTDDYALGSTPKTSDKSSGRSLVAGAVGVASSEFDATTILLDPFSAAGSGGLG